MQAGRELDALVAEHVMGWSEPSNLERYGVGDRGLMFPCPPHPAMRFPPSDRESSRKTIGGFAYWEINHAVEIPHYSTDIGAACKVFERICNRSADDPVFEKYCLALGHNVTRVIVRVPPVEICLAALKAVGVEVPA